MIELIFLKELTVTRQVNQKSVIFATIGIFLNKGFQIQLYVCYRCNDFLIMSMTLSNITILKIKIADYRSIISGFSKCEAKHLLQNIDLTEKVEHYKN